MEILDRERSVVLVIDMQGRLMEIVHRPELVRAAAVRLLRLADLFEVPVLLTEQYPRGLGPTHPEILSAYEELGSRKRRLEKESFGCCGEPEFEATLEQLRPGLPAARRQLVIVGIEAHVCVVQTVLELRRQDTATHLCWEGVSSRGAEYRRHAIDRMHVFPFLR